MWVLCVCCFKVDCPFLVTLSMLGIIVIISSVDTRHIDSENWNFWSRVRDWLATLTLLAPHFRWHSIDLSNLKSFLIEFTRMRRPVVVCCCVSWNEHKMPHAFGLCQFTFQPNRMSAQWSDVDVSQFQWFCVCVCLNEKKKQKNVSQLK